MITYHARMQIIQCDTTGYGTKAERLACADGHAVARHACAEIANEADAEVALWKSLYRRAINEANGLTNYVEDRPELRSAEKRIAAIEYEARAALGEKP